MHMYHLRIEPDQLYWRVHLCNALLECRRCVYQVDTDPVVAGRLYSITVRSEVEGPTAHRNQH